MTWHVEFHDDFESEFGNLSEEVQDGILSTAALLARVGPSLKRPHADTLKGSKHANMKELRCIAFAFDRERKAILLTAGDKVGVNEKRFYKTLIAKADERFDQHLAEQERKK